MSHVECEDIKKIGEKCTLHVKNRIIFKHKLSSEHCIYQL